MTLSAKDLVSVVVALTSLLTAINMYLGKEQQTQRAAEYSSAADTIAATCVPALIECMESKGE